MGFWEEDAPGRRIDLCALAITWVCVRCAQAISGDQVFKCSRDLLIQNTRRPSEFTDRLHPDQFSIHTRHTENLGHTHTEITPLQHRAHASHVDHTGPRRLHLVLTDRESRLRNSLAAFTYGPRRLKDVKGSTLCLAPHDREAMLLTGKVVAWQGPLNLTNLSYPEAGNRVYTCEPSATGYCLSGVSMTCPHREVEH